MTKTAEPFSNQILDKLPPDIIERLQPNLEHCDAALDHQVYSAYEPIEFVYFPLNSMISIVAMTSNGQTTEIGVIGPEGAAGLEVVLGTARSPHMSMFQIAGPAYRIKSKYILREFNESQIFRQRILHFVQKMTVQVSQTTLCNRLHRIDERLPRWLLMCDDRIVGRELRLTQEFIAIMLGTSRVSVTQAAHALQQTGFIKYQRGRIEITDREALEEMSCECYQIVQDEYALDYRG